MLRLRVREGAKSSSPKPPVNSGSLFFQRGSGNSCTRRWKPKSPSKLTVLAGQPALHYTRSGRICWQNGFSRTLQNENEFYSGTGPPPGPMTSPSSAIGINKMRASGPRQRTDWLFARNSSPPNALVTEGVSDNPDHDPRALSIPSHSEGTAGRIVFSQARKRANPCGLIRIGREGSPCKMARARSRDRKSFCFGGCQ